MPVILASKEDRGSKPDWTKSSPNPISKNTIMGKKKRAAGVAQGIGPEFNPQITKKKKKSIFKNLVKEEKFAIQY
jgi:hypothetical protein